ncbi:MAG: hypothetical protein RLZZ15_3690 [Verrucomicrobiota bacterium]|jgi:biopolymer transport protein ExbD/biopolymer transport protein TolR
MARNFRRHRTSHPIADLNVTNLIDLGFMLLIIFMVASPLINKQEQTIPVQLPVESKSAQAPVDKQMKFHSVIVGADGRYFLDEKKTPLSLTELKTVLRGYTPEKDKTVIRLRLDAKTSAQQFITVMDELKKAELTSVTFDTQTAK